MWQNFGKWIGKKKKRIAGKINQFLTTWKIQCMQSLVTQNSVIQMLYNTGLSTSHWEHRHLWTIVYPWVTNLKQNVSRSPCPSLANRLQTWPIIAAFLQLHNDENAVPGRHWGSVNGTALYQNRKHDHI